MGMETLNSAARAAGFAMASSDEPLDESAPVETKPAAVTWTSTAPLLLQDASRREPSPSKAEWVKGIFSYFHRGAHA